jgi:hypothetical protein
MELKNRLRKVLEQRKIPPSKFGRTYFNDPGFVSRVLGGADIRVSTAAKLEQVLKRLENDHN